MFDVLKGEGSLCFGGAFRPLRFPKCFNKVALSLLEATEATVER